MDVKGLDATHLVGCRRKDKVHAPSGHMFALRCLTHRHRSTERYLVAIVQDGNFVPILQKCLCQVVSNESCRQSSAEETVCLTPGFLRCNIDLDGLGMTTLGRSTRKESKLSFWHLTVSTALCVCDQNLSSADMHLPSPPMAGRTDGSRESRMASQS